MMKSLSVTVALLMLVASSVFPQQRTSDGRSQKECVAEARIEFVRYGKRPSIYSDESDERVWLRLVNESAKGSLNFDAEDSQRTLDFLKRESKELDIYYEAVKKENCGSKDEIVYERPVGYTRREAYTNITLKPGQSFVFSVARQHLSDGHAIYLGYYLSNKSTSTDEWAALKKVYFFSSQLP